ncbi:hypothetical protein [Nocardia farcinica]|nr:hypothetical protein [Nocardia farcinica]
MTITPAKPDYPSGYLAQLAEPFTRHGTVQPSPEATAVLGAAEQAKKA